jgi:hypothetical protein
LHVPSHSHILSPQTVALIDAAFAKHSELFLLDQSDFSNLYDLITKLIKQFQSIEKLSARTGFKVQSTQSILDDIFATFNNKTTTVLKQRKGKKVPVSKEIPFNNRYKLTIRTITYINTSLIDRY